MAAMQRAALLARETAIRTGTHLVIVKDGQLLRIPAAELRGRDALVEAIRPMIGPPGGVELELAPREPMREPPVLDR